MKFKDRGVYTIAPAGTPRYHTGNGPDSVNSQARLYVDFADQESFERFRERIPIRARTLLEVISPQSSSGGLGYVDFLLHSVQENFSERVQVAETLSDEHVAYFFGQRAAMWGISGTLLNTVQDPWYDAFQVLYTDILRGSKLAQHQTSARLVYGQREIVGSIVSMNTSINSDMETAVPFTLQFLVKELRLKDVDNLRPTRSALGGRTGLNDIEEARQKQTSLMSSIEEAQRSVEEASNVAKDMLSEFREGIDVAEVEERATELDATTQGVATG